jgi:fructosamine-3-kinase
LGSPTPEPAADEELGRRLARMHLAGADRFGALPPGAAGDRLRIGELDLPNDARPSWAEFYADNRLRPLAERAGLAAEVEAVAARLPDLAGPDEPPARLHGDLWSGNVFGAYLIDPAAYGGHREIDLAMLRLFGSPGARLLAAYDELAPRADGHEERVELHQLFPLLVHAVLFGGGYVAQARAVARRYA